MLTFVVQDGITAPSEKLDAAPRPPAVMLYQHNSMPPLYVQLTRPDGVPLPFSAALPAQATWDVLPITTWSHAHHSLWMSLRKPGLTQPWLVDQLRPLEGTLGHDNPEPFPTSPVVPPPATNPGGLQGRFVRAWGAAELTDPGEYQGEMFVRIRHSTDPTFLLELQGLSVAEDVLTLDLDGGALQITTPTLPIGTTPVEALQALQEVIDQRVLVDTTTEPSTTVQYLLLIDSATPTQGTVVMKRSQHEAEGNDVVAVLHVPEGLTVVGGAELTPPAPGSTAWTFSGGQTLPDGVQTLGYFKLTVHPSQIQRSS